MPTTEGKLFYTYVRKALDMLIEGSERLRRSQAERPLRVQTYVTASIRWLTPRLPAFMAAHPDVRLLLSTCAPEWDFDESLGDVGLVYCEAPPGPEYYWVPLFDYSVFPVCSPALRARLPENPEPRDLQGLPLVVIYSETRNWDIWFESAGVSFVPDSQVVVDTLAIALQMALDGTGIALVNGPFAEQELKDGRLVRPVAHQVRCPGSWGLICRQDMRDNDRVRVFMDWFASNAAAPGAT